MEPDLTKTQFVPRPHGQVERLDEVLHAASRHGIAVGGLIATGGLSLVFGASTEEWADCVLKVPWADQKGSERPLAVLTLPGGPTGPFDQRAIVRLDEAARVLAGACERMRAVSPDAPLARLLKSFEAAGLPCAVLERIGGGPWAAMTSAAQVESLPEVARTLARLHRTFGPHGDVKPDNVIVDGGRVIFVDPLPLDHGHFATRGFHLALPICELRDLIGLAECAVQTHGATLGLDRVELVLANRNNGRFGRNYEQVLRHARADLSSRLTLLPGRLREWVEAVVGSTLVGLERAPVDPIPPDFVRRWIDEAAALQPGE